MGGGRRAETFLHDAGALLASGEPLRALLDPAFDDLRAYFDAPSAALVLPAEEGYRVAHASGIAASETDEVRAAAAAVSGDAPSDSACMAAVMHAGDEIVGVVTVAAPPAYLGAAGALVLQTWASMLSLRLRQGTMEEEYRRLESIAESDQLTGLANRRAFDARVRANFAESRSAGTPLSIAIFDIDFFKAYNDRYGHIAGDAALRRVAATLRHTLGRPRDLVARFGGEEFVAVMPDTSETAAIELAERMAEAVRGLRIAHAGSGLGIVTVSAGIATAGIGDIDATDTLARADTALYRAKEAGRNRVGAREYLSDSESAARTEAGVHGIPVAHGPFVGRRDELSRLAEALDRGRMITLAGPGGAGKTRLASEAAARVANRYRDGVWYVDISAARDEAGIVTRIATALAISQHDLAIADAVVERLRAQRVLLILDGCEHCIEGARAVADTLLREVERVRLLACSRETLGIAGEAIVRVAGLRPDEARELFVALTGDPSLARGETERATIDAICRQIGFMPLGIELVVQQLAPISLGRLQLLVSGRMDPLRSLDDVIAWSVGLLGERRRVSFLALSVFAGGFDEEAARAVADIEPPEIDALESRSLLALHPAAERRFSMLDVVADYARRSLATDARETLRRKHFEYFRALARDGNNARLDLEGENLTAALDYADERGLRDEMLAMSASLAPFWLRRGTLNAGLTWLERALARRERANEASIALANRYAGMISRRLGNFEAARDYNERALHGWRALENVEGVGSALNGLALIAHTTGDFDRAEVLYGESMKHSRQLGDGQGVAMAINNLGGLAMFRGDYDQAATLLEGAIERAATLKDEPLEALSMTNLGEVRFLQGRFDEAIATVRQGLSQRERIGDRPGLAASWTVLANALLSAGRATEAWGPAREALLLNHEIGDRRGLATALLTTARLLQAQGRRDDVARIARDADALYRRSGAPLFGAEQVIRTTIDVPAYAPGEAAAGFDAAFEEALATFR